MFKPSCPSEELIQDIFASVKEQASQISTFKARGGGYLFIAVRTYCKDAREYFGLLPNEAFRPYFFPILPSKSERIVIPEEDNISVCTVSFAVMKAFDAFYALDEGGVFMSGVYSPDSDGVSLDYDCGYAHHLGSIIFRIMVGSEHFCDICVTTSGARAREDVRCSKAAKKVVDLCFSTGYTLVCPSDEEIDLAIMSAEYFDGEGCSMDEIWRRFDENPSMLEAPSADDIERDIHSMLEETSSGRVVP